MCSSACRQAALYARSEFERVLHYLRPATEGWQTKAFNSSALKGEGVDAIWSVVTKFDEITAVYGKATEKANAHDYIQACLLIGIARNNLKDALDFAVSVARIYYILFCEIQF